MRLAAALCVLVLSAMPADLFPAGWAGSAVAQEAPRTAPEASGPQSTADTLPIRQVPYADVRARSATRVDFEDLPRRFSPGMSIDGVLRVDGAALGERFVGQRLGADRGFDVLGPVADPPLSLLPGRPGQNLALSYIYGQSNLLSGLAPPGWPAVEAGGEGAIAAQFDRDQEELGFRVAADPRAPDADDRAAAPSVMHLAFFRRDASLIATLTVHLTPARGEYGFARPAGVADIAGVTITNADPQGIAIDDLVFDRRAILSFLHADPRRGATRICSRSVPGQPHFCRRVTRQ